MTSRALVEWSSVRKGRIDQLLAAHASVGGSGSGRRWRTEQLNWALVLKIAGEFQGFTRELHDEAVEFFATQAGALNAPLTSVLRNELTRKRVLDKGNANPGSIGDDFGRLGIRLWPQLRSRYASAGRWHDSLVALNDARNAIAHDNRGDIAALAAAGWPLSQLETCRKFRRAADSTAKAMDTVVGSHLSQLFGGSAPW